MPNLYVRAVDRQLVERLRKKAHQHRRSMAEEHRQILREALFGGERAEVAALAEKLRKLTSERRHTPAERLVRESRSER